MPNALLAGVVVSDAARFDIEQKILAGLSLTTSEAEQLLAMALQTKEEAVEELEGAAVDAEELEKAYKRANDAEAELIKLEKAAVDPDAVRREIKELEGELSAVEVERNAALALAQRFRVRLARPALESYLLRIRTPARAQYARDIIAALEGGATLTHASAFCGALSFKARIEVQERIAAILADVDIETGGI